MIAVIGAGAWGTALAQTLRAAGADVRLWARDPALAAGIARQRRNPAYLPNIALDPGIEVTSDLPAVVEGATVVILAVPTHGLRAVAQACAEHLADGCAVVSAAKGLETVTGLRMTEVLESVLGAGRPVAALSGPNIALEVARGLPAASVVAAADRATAERVRDALNGPRLRIYSNEDVIGVELGGALKNVVAIAAGIGDGVGAGDNGKAALVTRGLAEMARLGVAMGARAITFAGLTGLGDCFVTCISPHSRNRRLGELVGRGQSLTEVQAGMFQVAEGVNAARAARLLSQRHGVEMPIVDAVCAVLFEGKPVDAALTDLMTRGARDELSELWPA